MSPRPTRNRRGEHVLSWAGLVVLACSAVLADDALPETVEFNRDVRPILSDKCFSCHGPDESQRKADLRLDTREGALAALDEGHAIVPGKPDESELIARVTTDNRRRVMPPVKSKKTISDREVAILRRWIEQGAPWQGHWAYEPPRRPSVPELEDDDWSRNPIDRFVLRGLRRAGLEPAARADGRTLTRRLHFDLTGLPPRPEDVEARVEESTDEAGYDALAERLLSSTTHAERMAMLWLDLVRFADTNGIHGDNHRDVWLYRDWVIDAFERNMPFDRFTVEQLAGDLIPESSWQSKVASGYNRLLMTTREGGAQPKEYLAKYAADRVRNASTVWLGATLGCAECHDHKFDPYTSRDFYSFAAFFADLQETAVGVQQPTKVPSPEQERRLAELDARIGELKAALAADTPALAAARAEWERSFVAREPEWRAIAPTSISSAKGAALETLDDASVRVGGPSPDVDVYELVLEGELGAVSGLRLEALPDDALPSKGPGRAGNGNFVVNEVEVLVDGEPVKITRSTATHSQQNWPDAAAADGDAKSGWAILPRAGQRNVLVCELEGSERLKAVRRLAVRLHQSHGGAHTLGRLRLSVTGAERPIVAGGIDGVPADIAEILRTPAESRDAQAIERLAAHWRASAPELEPLRRDLAAAEKERADVDRSIPTTLISIPVAPRTMRVLPRGNWLDDSGPVVEPSVPAFLGSLDTGDRRANRLDLAEWLVSKENPLTSRVLVNRLWKMLFGRGLVRSLDDFGSQGGLPSHPELLDWLATELVESGWDVRHVLRLIVDSSTYRQSSATTPELRSRDPYNRLLAHQGRFRLDAEMVRDNALAVSGLLVLEKGGPSVKPYQPAGYWSHLNFPRREWQKDAGPAVYRRGLYTYWCRTFLHPSLLAFDAPTREECTVDRVRSNTPLQALVLLNDPTYVESARALAERVVREGGEATDARISWLFREVLARAPSAAELGILGALLGEHLEQYRADVDAAKRLLAVGDKSSSTDLDPGELAAWVSVVRVVLNLHETITRS